jgi:hypothetical protein
MWRGLNRLQANTNEQQQPPHHTIPHKNNFHTTPSPTPHHQIPPKHVVAQAVHTMMCCESDLRLCTCWVQGARVSVGVVLLRCNVGTLPQAVHTMLCCLSDLRLCSFWAQGARDSVGVFLLRCHVGTLPEGITHTSGRVQGQEQLEHADKS